MTPRSRADRALISATGLAIAAVISFGLVGCGGAHRTVAPCVPHCGQLVVHFSIGSSPGDHPAVLEAVVSRQARVVAAARLGPPARSATLVAGAGHFTLQVLIRRCRGSCSHLAPPVRCQIPVDLSDRHPTTVTVSLPSGDTCAILTGARSG